MIDPVVIFICNALDDHTRSERSIVTDSPAASHKIFEMCKALKLSGVRPYVLSIGRGRATGKIDYFSSFAKANYGVPTVYAPFSHIKVISSLLSLTGLCVPLYKIRSRSARVSVIFYNRMPAYLLLLMLSSFLKCNCYLDLEDGEVQKKTNTNDRGFNFSKLIIKIFDKYCSSGALLACSALSKNTKIHPTLCYYGSVYSVSNIKYSSKSKCTCLVSGTLSEDTGMHLLIDAIRRMRSMDFQWVKNIQFKVTGSGSSLNDLILFSKDNRHPHVTVYGRVTDIEYRAILEDCTVGFALKPVGGPLADTTFPSKVIQFSSAGLLVISTNISDVRQVLEDGAYYLDCNDPSIIIHFLRNIVADPRVSREVAYKGQTNMMKYCAQDIVGRELKSFLIG